MKASGVKHEAMLTLGMGLARYCKQAIGRSLVCATLLAVVGGGNAALGQANCNASWNVLEGNWTRPGNWRPARLPGQTSNVCLTNGTEKTQATTNLTLTKTSSIESLTIGPDNLLSVTSGKDNAYTFKVRGNMTNSGTLSLGLQPTGKPQQSMFRVDKSLTNSGTITGLGWLYITGSLNNAGTGTIESKGGTLTISSTKNAKITNTGTMAAGTGQLKFLDSTINNTGGVITGGVKGHYVEFSNTTIRGGTLFGPMEGNDTALEDLALIGTYDLSSQGKTTLAGTITLGGRGGFGTIGVDAGYLFVRGETKLTGNGIVRLTDEDDSVIATPKNLKVATLTLDQDVTIAGTGLIGKYDDKESVGLNVINNGSILANVKGKKLVINPGAGNRVTNTATGSIQAMGGGTLALTGRIVNRGAINAGPDSTVDITNANVDGNRPTKDKKGTIEGKGNAKVSVNSSSLDNLAINMITGSSLDASGSSISGGSITASTASINFDNTTASNDAISLLNSGILRMESSTISGGSLALSGSSTVLADGGTSNIALSIVDPGRFTVTPDAMLQILQDQETGGRTTIDGIMQALNGLTVTRGTLTGSGVIIGNLMLAGVLKPGDSGPGSITIQGNYSQSRPGLLDEELVSPSQYNRTDITQSAALDGTLYIHLSDGFVPAVGQTFEIMDFASSTGTFDRVLGEYLDDGEKFDVIYNPTNVMLDVVSSGPTPEPGSLFLFGSGILGLSVFLRKRLHKTA